MKKKESKSSYISETYNLSSEISILTGVLLPIFSIVCTRIALALYEKKLKNPLQCAGIIFAAGAVSALLLTCVSGNSAMGSVLGAARDMIEMDPDGFSWKPAFIEKCRKAAKYPLIICADGANIGEDGLDNYGSVTGRIQYVGKGRE